MNIFEPWIVSNSHTEYVRDLSTQDIICAMIALKHKKLSCSVKQFETLVYYWDLYQAWQYVKDYDKDFNNLKDIDRIYERLQRKEDSD